MSALGRSLTSKANASPIRKPHPYSNTTKARSRNASQFSFWWHPAVLIKSNAWAREIGCGKDFGTLGERTTASAGLVSTARDSKNLKKLRKVDNSRASDVRDTSFATRLDKKARKSVTFSSFSMVKSGVWARYWFKKDRKADKSRLYAATVCPEKRFSERKKVCHSSICRDSAPSAQK